MAQIGENKTHFLAHLIAQVRFKDWSQVRFKDRSLSVAVRPHLVCKHSSIQISTAFFFKVAVYKAILPKDLSQV